MSAFRSCNVSSCSFEQILSIPADSEARLGANQVLVETGDQQSGESRYRKLYRDECRARERAESQMRRQEQTAQVSTTESKSVGKSVERTISLRICNTASIASAQRDYSISQWDTRLMALRHCTVQSKPCPSRSTIRPIKIRN